MSEVVSMEESMHGVETSTCNVDCIHRART